MKKESLLTIALLGSVASAPAQVMYYNGTDQGGTVRFSAPSVLNSHTDYFAGTLKFRDAEIDGTHIFDTVCGDLADQFPPPYQWNATVYDSASIGGGIGLAGCIVEWASFHNLDGSENGYYDLSHGFDNSRSMALQLAVWEAEYNAPAGPITSDLDFYNALATGSSNFRLSSGSLAGLGTGTGSILDDAFVYWQHRNDGFNSLFIQANGWPGYSAKGQDMFAPVRPGGVHHVAGTPEPFTMGLGLAGAALFLKRRKRIRRV